MDVIDNMNTIDTTNNTDTKRSLKPKLITLVFCSTVIALLILMAFVVWIIQPKIFFHPWHDAESYEHLLTEDGFVEISIDNNGETLSGWMKINTEETEAPLLIFYGGNAQNSSNTCVKFLDDDTYKYFENYNFMIVDYPGYGFSDGKPSEESIFKAALATYDYACELECVDNERIVVIGYSIGTGVATYVASQRDVNGLILVAPYDCALNLCNNVLNIFHGPLKLLARYDFDSISYAKDVKTLPLIITSKSDEVINCELSLNLSKHFPIVPEVLLLDYVGHDYYFDQSTTLRCINRYLQEKAPSTIENENMEESNDSQS